MDSHGRLFVGDRGNNRIKILDQSGKLLDIWYQFSRPSGIYIDQHDSIYVADSESGRRGARSHRLETRHSHWQRAGRGKVVDFIPDPTENATNTSAARGRRRRRARCDLRRRSRAARPQAVHQELAGAIDRRPTSSPEPHHARYPPASPHRDCRRARRGTGSAPACRARRDHPPRRPGPALRRRSSLAQATAEPLVSSARRPASPSICTTMFSSSTCRTPSTRAPRSAAPPHRRPATAASPRRRCSSSARPVT